MPASYLPIHILKIKKQYNPTNHQLQKINNKLSTNELKTKSMGADVLYAVTNQS